jgi:hypothetical protein
MSLALAVAVGTDDEHVAVMGQPIESSACQQAVGEGVGPFGQSSVAGQGGALRS